MSTRSRTGMTLMELVIALAITGMMAAAGTSAFGSIVDHRRTIRDASTSTERAAALREMLISWITAGNIRIQAGGLPGGLSRAATTRAPSTTSTTSSTASVTAAQGSADELSFTTQAVNPSFTGNVTMRLYVDGDANTPEKGLSIEYQPDATRPLVRKMLDSTVDSLRVEFLDQTTNRWVDASQAAAITPKAVRVTLLSSSPDRPRILSVPMIFVSNLVAQVNTPGR
ncbi:MAG TPA: prepilin-type N-terminal cleavage/methylation domain-containing protein [Gemmatimonadaceae bacterium]|jgi:prepilin-type N-terminal cleavage/methylation domain-containing protein